MLCQEVSAGKSHGECALAGHVPIKSGPPHWYAYKLIQVRKECKMQVRQRYKMYQLGTSTWKLNVTRTCAVESWAEISMAVVLKVPSRICRIA
jgi:hypothetical protein